MKWVRGNWTSDCWDNEKPVHEVCIDGFWIGKFEVTQGQWKKIMGSNPSYFKKGDNYPVEQVSWNDAKEFIEELNIRSSDGIYRLPTEAEWEYACRSGGKGEKYSGGSRVDLVAWYTSNSGGSTHPVGTKASNGLGIYDMSGNVGEWCQDVWDSNAYSKHGRNNPVVRSGGFYRVLRDSSGGNETRSVRCACRGGDYPGYRHVGLGFRLLKASLKEDRELVEDVDRPDSDTEQIQIPKISAMQVWYVQVGAFKSEDGAMELRDRLVDAGFPTLVAFAQLGSRILYVVRVGPYPSRVKAEIGAEMLREKGHPAVIFKLKE